MEDAAIVALYWSRSEEAIAESARKYGPYCRAVALRILVREEDAEECVGDTWLRAWDSMPPHRPSVLSAFLGKITRRLALDRWRSEKAEKRGGGQLPLALRELEECLPASGGVEETLEAAETAVSISRFLRAQSELDRRLFVRRYWHLERVEALAKGCGLGLSQTKSRLSRTRKRLKAHLEKEGIFV